MLAESLLAAALAALAACSARSEGAPGDELAGAAPQRSTLALVAPQTYRLPDVPDDLLTVPDPQRPQLTLSLRDGTVVGALTTAPSAAGEEAALVYRCLPDAAGVHRWTVFPEGGLMPLGVAPALRRRTLAEIAGEVDAQARSPNASSVPLYRYREGNGLYVLRLDTRGGLGPADEGAACAAGTPEVRSPIRADFYFVAVPGRR